MLIRLRSTTIGLLGIVTAVGLVLIVFASQVGWPGVLSGPLPAAPAPDVIQNDTIALAQVETHPLPATRGIAGKRPQTAAKRHDETASNVESDVANADQIAEAPAEHPAPAPSSPPAQAPPAPIPPPTAQQPPTSTPASGDKADEAETPGPTVASAEDKSRGRGKAKGHERSDWPGNSAARHDERRGSLDQQGDADSSPSLSEDGDDEESDEPSSDDRSRGKSNGHRH